MISERAISPPQRGLYHELGKSSEKHPGIFSVLPSSKVMVLSYGKIEIPEAQNIGC